MELSQQLNDLTQRTLPKGGVREELLEADSFLKEHEAIGVLIGGRVSELLYGSSEREVEERKDTDILVLENALEIRHSSCHYDLFLKKSDGTFRNRHNGMIHYYLHYRGKPLNSGLYLPPPQVVYLTECHLATRKELNRVIPEILPPHYMPVAKCLKQLNPLHVTLEFPGDFSWFANVWPDFPVQIDYHKDTKSQRVYISFPKEDQSKIPQTAFPNIRDFSALDSDDYGNILEKSELDESTIKYMAKSLISGGYKIQAIEFLEKHDPKSLDNYNLTYKLFNVYCDESMCEWQTKGNSRESVQLATVFIKWLSIAVKHNFSALKTVMGDDPDTNEGKYGIVYR